jgi:hypothetical protein
LDVKAIEVVDRFRPSSNSVRAQGTPW